MGDADDGLDSLLGLTDSTPADRARLAPDRAAEAPSGGAADPGWDAGHAGERSVSREAPDGSWLVGQDAVVEPAGANWALSSWPGDEAPATLPDAANVDPDRDVVVAGTGPSPDDGSPPARPGESQEAPWMTVGSPAVGDRPLDLEEAVGESAGPNAIYGDQGVDDIHSDEEWVDDGAPLFVSVPVGAIEPNEFQPRSRFVEEELDSLAASILEVGVLQPVLLRRIDIDRYELIAGERRWRAAIRAGLTAVPAIVRAADDQSSLEQAVVENLHRADLNPLEEAAAYRQLIDEFSLTQDGVAQRVGKSRSAVANLLRLFQLPGGVQRLIASGELGGGHARALLAFPDPAFQDELAVRAVREGLTVRRVEELVRQASQRSAEPDERTTSSTRPDAKSAAVLAVEELLSEHLATRVEVSRSGARGRIVVEFADEDDLDRLAELLLTRAHRSAGDD